MAIPPVFFARVQNGSEAIGYRLLAGKALSPIPASGVYIGSSQTESNNLNSDQLNNRMVEFGGKVFVWVREKIYEINTDSDTWTLVHTIATSPPTTGNHSGLYYIEINNVPSLIGLYSYNPAYYITYDETSGWQDMGSIGGKINATAEMFVYRNVLFALSGYSSVWFDPSLPSYSTSGVIASGTISYAVHKGYLYAMTYATNLVYMYRFTGTGFTGLGYPGQASLGLFVQYVGYNQGYAKNSLVSFDGDLYGFCWGRLSNTSDTYKHLEVFKFTASGDTVVLSTDEVRLTTSVSPWTTSTSSITSGVRIWGFIDCDTDPTNPEMYFFIILDGLNGSWTTYKWNGESSVMSLVGAIGAYGLVPSASKNGGGDYVWTEDTINCSIEERAKGNGGIEYTVKAFGDPSLLTHGSVTGGTGFEAGETVEDQTSGATGTITRVNSTAGTLEVGGVSGTFGVGNVVKQTSGTGINSQATVSAETGGGADYKLRLYYSELEEPPDNLGTLTGAVSGGVATRNGNVVENVLADGIIEYTFIWAFPVDGISIGVYFSDRLRISVS